MSTRLLISLVITWLFGCRSDPYSSINIAPGHFKMSTPFLIGTHGILINTNWGADKKHHVLFIDNFSPSWIKKSVLQADGRLLHNSAYNFKTSTGSGKLLEGNVGLCDSLLFGAVAFNKAPFYIIDSEPDDQTYDGAFGSELMSKGIWKIDFKNNVLTFVSSIDSLPESAGCEPIVAVVDNNRIVINVKSARGLTQPMFVDLGFNGDLLVSEDDSMYLSSRNKFSSEQMMLSTPSDTKIVSRLSAIDTVQISNHWFVTMLSTRKSSKDRLIGLQFFKRFQFIIIDFKNKKLLVPKMVF